VPKFLKLASWQLRSGYFQRLLFSQAGPCGGGFRACRVRVMTGCHAGGDGEVPRVGVQCGQLRFDSKAALSEQGAQAVCRRLQPEGFAGGVGAINQGDVASAINVAPQGVRIDGRLLHVTGETQFDGNVIANHMLQAMAVTADKLNVGSLSAISANIGLLRTRASGERVEMENNQIRVYDANNRLRVRMGVW